MSGDIAAAAAAAARLRYVLDRFADLDPALPVDWSRPDAVTQLGRIRYRHLGDVDALLGARHCIPAVRVEALLGFRSAIGLWMQDLGMHPGLDTAPARPLDRAVIDATEAVLLAQTVRDFYPTQRRIMFCLAELNSPDAEHGEFAGHGELRRGVAQRPK